MKHLIECHCVLPQFRDDPSPPYHRFVVFSELDGSDNVIPKHAQCNNCGVIHRVFDVCKSEIALGKDASAAVVTVSDVRLSMPTNVIQILESYDADIATWEESSHILEKKLWGSFVVLSSESKDGVIDGKCLRFNGPNSVRVEPFSTELKFPGR